MDINVDSGLQKKRRNANSLNTGFSSSYYSETCNIEGPFTIQFHKDNQFLIAPLSNSDSSRRKWVGTASNPHSLTLTHPSLLTLTHLSLLTLTHPPLFTLTHPPFLTPTSPHSDDTPTSPPGTSLFGFQQSTQLSLEAESNRSES